MFDVINRKKPSMAKLGKEVDFHYAHVRTVLRQFQQEKLIKPIFDVEQAEHSYDPGNPYKVELTLKGRLLNEVLQMFKMIQREIGIIELMEKLQIKKEKEVKNGRTK